MPFDVDSATTHAWVPENSGMVTVTGVISRPKKSASARIVSDVLVLSFNSEELAGTRCLNDSRYMAGRCKLVECACEARSSARGFLAEAIGLSLCDPPCYKADQI